MTDKQQTEQQEAQHEKAGHDNSGSELNDNSNSGHEEQHKGSGEPVAGDDPVAEPATDQGEAERQEGDQEPAAGDNGDVTVAALQEKIRSLEQSVADNLDRVQRAQAELDNIRKRSRRDIENAHKYSLEKFINELLPILDSMELGINAAENADDVAKLHEGMNLTMQMFLSSLERFGVARIAPQQGDKFDPGQHEAVSMQEDNNTGAGNIISVLQKGYRLNDRLIRPATVIVAK